MFKLGLTDASAPPVWVNARNFTIGSDSDCNLVLAHPSVSPIHARLTRDQDQLFIRAENSHCECRINGQKITRKQLLAGDTLQIGELTLAVSDSQQPTTAAPNSWVLIADDHWLPGLQLELSEGPNLIGRARHCQLSLPGTHLAREHALLEVTTDGVRVKDLNSGTGTCINDERVSEGTAQHRDRLRFDIYSFHLIRNDEVASQPREIALQATPVNASRTMGNPEEKRWITKPTSPGNRIEPAAPPPNPWLHRLSLGLALVVVGLLAALILSSRP